MSKTTKQPIPGKITDEERQLVTAIREMDRKTRRLVKQLILHSCDLSLGYANFTDVKQRFNLPDAAERAVGVA